MDGGGASSGREVVVVAMVVVGYWWLRSGRAPQFLLLSDTLFFNLQIVRENAQIGFKLNCNKCTANLSSPLKGPARVR